MTAIRHGRELCLPGDDVEARSTSLHRNKCLHPSRHDGVGSGAILRYGWLDLSSSVFYDYCGRVCSGAHRCVPLLLLVAAAEPFVVGREGLVLGLLAWWCVSMVLHGASWRLAMALDQVRVGCFPGRCATSGFLLVLWGGFFCSSCESFGDLARPPGFWWLSPSLVPGASCSCEDPWRKLLVAGTELLSVLFVFLLCHRGFCAKLVDTCPSVSFQSTPVCARVLVLFVFLLI